MGEVLSGKLTLNERASKPRLGCFGLSKGYDEKNRVQETPDTVFYPRNRGHQRLRDCRLQPAV